MTSAITGGDIGRGMLTGAISGAIFGGIGHLANTWELGKTAYTLAHAMGGAASGGINAAIIGGDIGKWAMIGGIGGLAFSSISQLGVSADGSSTWQWGLARIGLSAVAGGGISELAGGSFGEGAAFAGAFAGADFLYRSVMNADPNTKGQRGTGRTADTSGQPRLDDQKALKVTGSSENPNTVGLAEQSGAKGLVHFFAGETGPVMNALGKYVPTFQGMSRLHDPVTTGFGNTFGKTANSLFFNFPSMAPCYAINVMSTAVNDYPALLGQYEIYGEESN